VSVGVVPPEIASALDPEETILWVGKPTDRFFAMSVLDALAFVFGLLFASVALFLQGTALSDGQMFPVFFGMPHLFIGLYLSIGRLFVSRRYRHQMTYAVSSRKAYILSKAFSGFLVQKPISKTVSIAYSPGAEATISLDPIALNHWQRQSSVFWPNHADGFKFFKISEGELVISLIRQTQRENL
jgi:hypothetical protein